MSSSLISREMLGRRADLISTNSRVSSGVPRDPVTQSSREYEETILFAVLIQFLLFFLGAFTIAATAF